MPNLLKNCKYASKLYQMKNTISMSQQKGFIVADSV